MAAYFDNSQYMPMFQTSLMVFSIITRVVNSAYLLSFKHKTKTIWAFCSFALAYTIYFTAFYSKDLNFGFILALICTLIIGTFTSLGGATVVGFMKGMPP